MSSTSRASSTPGPAATPRPPARGRPQRRTLWEEGDRPGPLVVRAALLVVLLATALEVAFTGELGLGFDVVLVLVCLGAALWVRPRDFFTVGVLPPLLLLGVVGVLTVAARGAVARESDPAAQAVVTGLAHHALALVVAYALTLAVLGLRQVALRNNGALRGKVARARAAQPPPADEPRSEATVPAQRTPPSEPRPTTVTEPQPEDHRTRPGG